MGSRFAAVSGRLHGRLGSTMLQALAMPCLRSTRQHFSRPTVQGVSTSCQ